MGRMMPGRGADGEFGGRSIAIAMRALSSWRGAQRRSNPAAPPDRATHWIASLRSQ
jgi:hypothetical protein